MHSNVLLSPLCQMRVDQGFVPQSSQLLDCTESDNQISGAEVRAVVTRRLNSFGEKGTEGMAKSLRFCSTPLNAAWTSLVVLGQRRSSWRKGVRPAVYERLQWRSLVFFLSQDGYKTGVRIAKWRTQLEAAVRTC